MSSSYAGSCLCGRVRYEFHTEPKVTVACHCLLCRKATGSVFATWTLASGTLDRAPALEIKLHAYVGSKASWYEMADSRPRFDELPTSAK
jgi:hypothetical protein